MGACHVLATVSTSGSLKHKVPILLVLEGREPRQGQREVENSRHPRRELLSSTCPTGRTRRMEVQGWGHGARTFLGGGLAAEGAGTGRRSRRESGSFLFCNQMEQEPGPASLFSAPLQDFSFPGHCGGTCVCLRQMGEAASLGNARGAYSNWRD